METRPLPDETELPRDEGAETEPTEDSPAPEFRLIVRKLELPVRPRGVLAE